MLASPVLYCNKQLGADSSSSISLHNTDYDIDAVLVTFERATFSTEEADELAAIFDDEDADIFVSDPAVDLLALLGDCIVEFVGFAQHIGRFGVNLGANL